MPRYEFLSASSWPRSSWSAACSEDKKTLSTRRRRLDWHAAPTLLVSPLSWGHYYMVETPAVLLAPIWLLRRGKPAQARIVAVIPPVLSWSHYLAMPYTGELGLLGLGTTVWFLGVCILIVGNEVAASLGRQVGQPCSTTEFTCHMNSRAMKSQDGMIIHDTY